MHSCISGLCIVASVLLLDTPYIGVACRIVHDWLVYVSRVRSALWLRVSRSPWFMPVVTHVSPYPFSMLLSDPCPAVVIVSNGLGRRSPRTRGI